ncbi:MAG: sigma-70 family RNA polymerase sigma factor [Anaerolineales bacterium]|nr:sigma-70 family RNA polymerase sigma factor [Anaerolineales bacterium]
MNDQEQDWVEAARRGDKQAFGSLVQAYQRPVFNLTYRMLGSAEEAEDAAQETFLRAYSRLGQYDPEMKFSTWLFSIANHHCIDRLRKRRATYVSIEDNPVLENLPSDTQQPEHRALDQERSREMQALINQLDPDYRTPLVLRYWEEMSYEEIAESMGMTVAAVKSRLFRARQQLVALYQRRETVMPPPGMAQQSGRPIGRKETGVQHALHVQLGLAGL